MHPRESKCKECGTEIEENESKMWNGKCFSCHIDELTNLEFENLENFLER